MFEVSAMIRHPTDESPLSLKVRKKHSIGAVLMSVEQRKINWYLPIWKTTSCNGRTEKLSQGQSEFQSLQVKIALALFGWFVWSPYLGICRAFITDGREEYHYCPNTGASVLVLQWRMNITRTVPNQGLYQTDTSKSRTHTSIEYFQGQTRSYTMTSFWE